VQISKNELSLKELILKGNEHYYNKEYNEAIECYDKALEIDPKDADTLNNKGNALDNLGKHKEAIECYDKALEIDPKHAIVLNNKGNALGIGTYSNTTKQALVWTKELSNLKQIVQEVTGTKFNSCLLHLYHNGNEGIGWHIDDEKSLKKNSTVASLSLGAE
jgi:tetratricopeptide (TPR) repeat protein